MVFIFKCKKKLLVRSKFYILNIATIPGFAFKGEGTLHRTQVFNINIQKKITFFSRINWFSIGN